jgi:hypothetical protein
VDEENHFYNQRANRASEGSSGSVPRHPSGHLIPNSKSFTDLRASKAQEEEQRAWRDRLVEEVKETVASQNEQIKSEFGIFVQEIVGQLKVMASSRKEDREMILGLQGDTDDLVTIIKSLGTRFERLEQRFFNYEMEISTIRDEGRVALSSCLEDHARGEEVCELP